ncbi:MAG: hypothetical protein EAX96_02200 [Candidatus Lokiarchaeota archaeon]|nr:hypothetical protein [Candidatus Lokiarchaeota archaeon]
MITNIFLISRATGACIYHKSYENNENQYDSALITGYLTALSDISEEIGGQAQELKLENKLLKYKFIDKETLICFIIDYDDIKSKKMKRNIEAVERIINKFKEIYPNGLDFNGDLSKYYGRNLLDHLIFDDIIYETLFKNEELSDFFEERKHYLKELMSR